MTVFRHIDRIHEIQYSLSNVKLLWVGEFLKKGAVTSFVLTSNRTNNILLLCCLFFWYLVVF
jgi:hypothetical protein